MCEEKTDWHGNHFTGAKQKMDFIEEYIEQGITAEICFSPKFAEATKKYFAHNRADVKYDKFLKKVIVLEAILKK